MDHRPDLLLYLVYGADSYHQEAVFSIASALARLRDTPQAAVRIEVCADRAEPYAALPVRVRALDAATLDAWCAPHGYRFRAKHVALRRAFDGADPPPARAILIDTDTFFHRSPAELFDLVRPGTLLCNHIGPRYGAHPENTLYRSLAKRLQARGLADDAMALTNSGVIGLAHDDRAVLDHALALMDEFHPHAEGAYTLEEFVLAVAAHAAGLALAECPTQIHHYWSRKQIFRAKIRAWLERHAAAPLAAGAVADIGEINARVPRPPLAQRLLYKLATGPLPAAQRQFARELLYGCYPHANAFDRACGPIWWEKAVTNLRERGPVADADIVRWLQAPVLRGLLGSDLATVGAHLRARGLLDA